MFLFTNRAEAAAPAGQDALTLAMRGASERSGVPFDFLLQTAKRESGLKPDAKAPTSSATGLFQFIEQTWLSLVREAGPAQGLTREAQLVQPTARGKLDVADPAERNRILDLRRDPALASRMAAALALKNREGLTRSLGREPTQGDLYVAHFLGLSGATQLIALKDRTPEAPAAPRFPEAASANRAIFFDRGRARGAGEVYARLAVGFGEAKVQQAARPDASEFSARAFGKPFHGLFRTVEPVAAPVTKTAMARAGAIGQPLDLLAFSRVRS